MLSNKQLTRLKNTNTVFEKDRVATALARKELVIPVTFDHADQGGGTQEKTLITTVADDSDSLDGKYFLIHDEAGSVGVWIDTDNSGTTIPAGANAADRALEVTTIATDDSANSVATKVAAVINADSKFTASASGNVITVTCVDPEAVTDASDGDTGFTFAVDTQGVTAINLGYAFEEDAIVTKVMSHELTNVTSGGSATVAVRAGSTALVAATAIASFTGVVNHTLSGSAAGIAVSKGDQLNIDVEVAPLTAGKVRFYVYAIPQRDI
jgi:hypothetical protein